MDTTNQKIINAIIEKANRVCPDSVALIGIYGSVATGDVHEKSDLDLLILIQNEEGWKLGSGFILNDKKVGYDIYCTDWNGLRYDAECHHAHLSKLMDSQIVHVNDPDAYKELLRLRKQAEQFLESEKRFQRADALVNKAKNSYGNACLYDELGQVRLAAFGVIHNLMDAVMLYHGTYFKRGVKRVFEELEGLPLDDLFADTIRKIVVSKDVFELRQLLKILILYTSGYMHREKPKSEPTDTLAGTYEEMYSNWRNKVEEAAESHDAFASFANMCSLHFMFKEISAEAEIGIFDIMDAYSADSLEDNVRTFDRYLEKYEEVYARAGIRVKRFADVDEFVASYLSE
jgi:hypothetical protein